MIDRTHDLPIVRQAKVLNISRGCVYYQPKSVSAQDLALMRRIGFWNIRSRGAGCCATFRTGRASRSAAAMSAR